MQPHTVQAWIDERDPLRLERLWQEADAARRAHVGDDVHLRGLIEISNICVRHCHYCGLRAPNAGVRRYRMTADEIVACVRLADELGYGTVVLQSGEDPAFAAEDVAEIVRRVKRETPLAVTLSLGERAVEEWALWKDAGRIGICCGSRLRTGRCSRRFIRRDPPSMVGGRRGIGSRCCMNCGRWGMRSAAGS